MTLVNIKHKFTVRVSDLAILLAKKKKKKKKKNLSGDSAINKFDLINIYK